MEIRKALKSEAAQIGAFYDKVVLWLDRHINYPKWIYGVYPSEGSAGKAAEAGVQYICLERGEIVGAFVMSPDPEGSYQNGSWTRSVPEGSYLVLHALAVAPERQRQGAGSEVVRFCIEAAGREGYEALRADVVPDNYPARTLFEKCGFTYAGEADLQRGMENIPAFSLYELNL